MALSTGGLAGIILFLILLHIGALVGYYLYMQKNPNAPSKISIDDQKHGAVRWMLLGLTGVSWIFSVAATAACTFVKVDLLGSEIGVGLNAYEDPEDGCTTFAVSASRNNPAFTFAVFNCLLTTAGSVLMVLLQFTLTTGRWVAWTSVRIIMYISMWCCLFTFYIQESETCDFLDCSLGGAGVAQVFNVIFLIIISALVFLIPEGDDTAVGTKQKTQALADDDQNFNENEAEGHPETVTETKLPDGSIERQVETTNPDGSKTVTKTIEKMESQDQEDGEEEDFINVGDDDSSEDEEPREEVDDSDDEESQTK